MHTWFCVTVLVRAFDLSTGRNEVAAEGVRMTLNGKLYGFGRFGEVIDQLLVVRDDG